MYYNTFNIIIYIYIYQWEFQDPKMEVLYLLRAYFLGIFPYIGLKNRPYICLINGRYLQFRFLKWPLIISREVFPLMFVGEILIRSSTFCADILSGRDPELQVGL